MVEQTAAVKEKGGCSWRWLTTSPGSTRSACRWWRDSLLQHTHIPGWALTLSRSQKRMKAHMSHCDRRPPRAQASHQVTHQLSIKLSDEDMPTSGGQGAPPAAPDESDSSYQ
jgi:hypothetical protein